MHWTQSYKGIELVDSGLAANVDSDGRLINVSGSPSTDPGVPSTDPGFGAARAVQIAADDAGVDAPAIESGPSGDDSETAFADGSSARLVIYTAGSGERLAWQVELNADSQHYFEYEIDASSGKLLARHNLVASENARTYDLWPNAQTFGPYNGGVAQLRPLKRLGGNDAWRYDTTAPPYNLGGQTLGGNQAFLILDINDDEGASGVFVTPSDGGPNWDFPQQYVNPGPPVHCPPGGRCTWDPAGPFQNFLVNGAQGGVQAYWFTNEMHDHLLAPPIGFTEASGNFELVNASGQGLANDDVFLQGLDGANTSVGYPDANHLNNANMLTLKDGISPIMQMYLFSQFPPGAPGQGDPANEVYGGDDAGVLMHEYVHGLSNRLVGGPNQQGTLQAPQAGAMGEAWSDWYAQDYLVGEGRQFDNRAKPGEIVQGKYEGFTVVRTQALDCKVGVVVPACTAPQGSSAGNGGYTYGDFGRIHGAPEVHDDGEIWGQTLWDLRDGLIAKHGVADGVSRAEQLITDGLRLSPVQPTFLDARNAILNADTVGKLNDKDVIWSVFAKRGMGSNASSSGPGDTKPIEGFVNPLKSGGGGGSACQKATKALKKANKKVKKAKAAVKKAKGKKKKKAQKKLKSAKKKAKKAKNKKKAAC